MKTYNISATDFYNKTFPRALNNIPLFQAPSNTVIKPNTLLREDLNMDSLDIMETVIVLENKYNINLSKADSTRIDTVEDIYNLFVPATTRKKRTEMLYHRAQNRYEKIHNNKYKTK